MEQKVKPVGPQQAILGLEQMIAFVAQGYMAEGYDAERAKDLTLAIIEQAYMKFAGIAERPKAKMKKPAPTALHLATTLASQINNSPNLQGIEKVTMRNLAAELIAVLKKG